jgi:hypothetical protein
VGLLVSLRENVAMICESLGVTVSCSWGAGYSRSLLGCPNAHLLRSDPLAVRAWRSCSRVAKAVQRFKVGTT